MFKHMSLSRKMAMGFGVLIVITGILGGVAWSGLRSVTQTADLQFEGKAALDALEECAKFRRDCALYGDEKLAGQEKNAAELWMAAHATLVERLDGLVGTGRLGSADVALVRAVRERADAYKSAFGKQVAARQMQDQAFAAWGDVGRQITAELTQVFGNVIAPAQQAAEQAGNVADLAKWTHVGDQLNTDIVQRFLALRVAAVYLLATNAEPQYIAYQEALKTLRDGVSAWASDVAGDAKLETVVTAVRGQIDQYAQAGENYHNGMLAAAAASSEMGTVAAQIVEQMGSLDASLHQQLEAVTARTNTLALGMALGAMIAGVLLAVIITRSIVRPINRIIVGLNEGAEQVNDAAGQVATASQQLAEGASEQASALEETSSALEEMAAMTRTNAANAQQANELTGQARAAAETGDQTMSQLNTAMSGINESSSQISKIIKVIEEIAFQTNLLALNAAVEAARAGEHGKGFAVVADEVRNLAMRAAEASREITTLIEDSVSRAREGTSVAGEVGKSLAAIVGDVAKVAELVSGIARASEEQAQGVEQVNTAVSQMDKVTQQNASGAEESASAAEEMAAQATAVKQMVDELAAVVGGAQAQSAGGGRAAPPAGRTTPKKQPTPARQPAKLVHAAPAVGHHSGPDDSSLEQF
jgi:methyl-accepting chemotaxis protein